MLTLHHLNNSQSQRVLWLLEELEVTYTLVTHIRDLETKLAPPSLHAATPRGKAPTLVTADGVVIIESSSIMAYLIRTYDQSKRFQPAAGDVVGVIRNDTLTSFAGASLGPFVSLKFFADVGAVADRTGGRFIEPRITSALAYLEDELDSQQDYFMGSSPGLADFMLSWEVDMVVQLGMAKLGPKMQAWHERVLARDGWKRALAKAGVPYDLKKLNSKL
ncbi:hypothetical protein RQP46_011375 [Phenoliferia psychrophenolica]